MPVSGSGDSGRANDEDWQSIVDNFGERAKLGEPETAEAPRQVDPDPPVVRAAAYDESERFVPPIPPPLPRPEPKRGVAWAGVFGVPVLVLIALVVQLDLPTILDYLLIGWFVGGILYLVATMPSGPREPWDDGSRI